MDRRYDLVIVGLGSGGILAAEIASHFHLKVAAVERDRIGGDCLWTGCVPSKALLASAKAADIIRHADRYGLRATEPEIDTSGVFSRIRAVQEQIADSDDNADRFTAMGVDVFFGAARLMGPNTVEVEGVGALRSRYILLCTGSRPSVPAIPGLAEAGFLTSETLWDLQRAPVSLVAIGGGPTSVEIAQAFARLGVRVTLLEKEGRILSGDEPALADRLAERLRSDGVDLVTDAEVQSVAVEDGVKLVRGAAAREPQEWRAQVILVGVGRRPNLDGLGLEDVGVETGPRGVLVNRTMRTSVKSIYAIGDLAGRFHFTHSAAYEAAAAVRNMFFPGSTAAPELVPWCTYTDPELAHAGLTESEARSEHGDADVRVWIHDLSSSDRARTDATTEGEIRIVTHKGRIVGAHVLAPGGGEVIHELALAIREGKKLSDLGSLVHVYPTLSVGIGQLAGDAAYDRAAKFGFLVRSRA